MNSNRCGAQEKTSISIVCVEKLKSAKPESKLLSSRLQLSLMRLDIQTAINHSRRSILEYHMAIWWGNRCSVYRSSWRSSSTLEAKMQICCIFLYPRSSIHGALYWMCILVRYSAIKWKSSFARRLWHLLSNDPWPHYHTTIHDCASTKQRISCRFKGNARTNVLCQMNIGGIWSTSTAVQKL